MTHEIVKNMSNVTDQLLAPGARWELESKVVQGTKCRLYKNAPKTLTDLINTGRSHGTKEFIVFNDERWTFSDFFARVDAISYVLRHQFSIQKGDRVAIAMRNYPEWMAAYSAIAQVGAVVVPLNSWGLADELTYGLKDSGAKVVFCDQRRLDTIQDQLATLRVKVIIVRPDKSAKSKHVHDLAVLLASVISPNSEAVVVDAEDTAQIMYTSGTTGKPKGAVSCHRAICQAIFNFELSSIASAMANSDAIQSMLQKGFAPKVMLGLPLFHVSGCYSVFLMSLRAGIPIVVMYKWDVEIALRTIQKERVTMVPAVPTMLWDVLNSPLWDKFDTSSLFSFGGGGAAQPPKMPSKIREKIPNVFPGTGYGMTESNATGFTSSGAAYDHKPLSGGLKSPIVDAKICDSDGNELPPGQSGEIWLHSPTLASGYWNKPEATAETFRDGWLVTGDIGYIDEEGYIFLTDRSKDMIIRGGENIYSAEIENCLLLHEDIVEVAAFGIPHESLGEELGVALTTRKGAPLNAHAVRSHVALHLAAFKVPTYVFFHHEPLPRNATQKVIKSTVRQFYIGRANLNLNRAESDSK